MVVPPGAPADEHVEVIALGRKFESRPPHRAPIGPDGAFRVAFARGTGRGWLMLDAKYLFLPTEVTLSPSADKTGTELRPMLGGCIRGRVVVPSEAEDVKRRLVGVQVDVRESGGSASPLGWITERSARIDSDLAFEVRGVPAGDRAVELRLPGAVPKAPTEVHVEPGVLHDVVVELVPSASVSGIVIDPAGVPIGAGAIVSAQSERNQEAATTTNGEGHFLIRDVVPGLVTLRARAEGSIGLESTRLTLAPGQAVEGLEIVLHRSARISGRVLAADGSGWNVAEVILRREDGPLLSRLGNPKPSLASDVDGGGRFEFTGLAPGVYRLQASDRKFRREPEPFEGSTRAGIALAEGGSIDDVELHLPAFGRVTGRVVGSDGKGVGGALALARGKDWNRGGDWRKIPITDGDGRFVIDGLPPGEVTITAVKQGHVASAEAHAIVRAGEAAEVVLELVPGTRLRFTGEKIPGVQGPFDFVARDDRGREWTLYPGWWESPGAATNEEMNDPRYGPLPPGRYAITVTAENGRTWKGSVELRGEAGVTVPMALGP